MLFLGAFSIGLGVVAIIASNWQAIPPMCKLLVDFAMLIFVVGGIFWAKEKNKTKLFELFLFLYALFILASIGLVAQIFHLPANGMSAILFWSILTFPLIFLSKKPLLAFVWLPAFFVSIAEKLMDINWFRDFVELLTDISPYFAPYLLVFLVFALYQYVFKRYNLLQQVTKALKFWTIILFAQIVTYADFETKYLIRRFEPSFTATMLWFAVIALVAFVCYYKSKNKQEYWWESSLFIFAVFSLLATSAPVISSFIAPIFTILMLSVVGLYGYKYNDVKLINIVSLLIAFRIFAIYIQVLGSLLSTGVGLICSGIVFLLMSYLWNRFRLEILTKAKELS